MFQKEKTLLSFHKIKEYLLCKITMVTSWLQTGYHMVVTWVRSIV
nr:MAG TPA: hypothetical protein [Caudoviricetes sp.]